MKKWFCGLCGTEMAEDDRELTFRKSVGEGGLIEIYVQIQVGRNEQDENGAYLGFADEDICLPCLRKELSEGIFDKPRGSQYRHDDDDD